MPAKANYRVPSTCSSSLQDWKDNNPLLYNARLVLDDTGPPLKIRKQADSETARKLTPTGRQEQGACQPGEGGKQEAQS